MGIMSLLCVLLLAACAKMGSPDGGWYDETPPKVIGANPADQGVNVNSKKIHIYFDEYVKVDNPTQNVVVSPPQIEPPEIKTSGKGISVELMDSLKANTTYTIDFSSAISDNNEGNPMGNFTYSFSTGNHIDTLQVSGYVVQADNLEPIKGVLVGLYDDLSDSAFKKKPMLRVSKTDSRGHFVIKGIAPGNYHIYALQDADGDYAFSQKSEMVAFSRDVIVPSFKPDTRQDTLWRDSLHIASITRVPYTHFLPDDISLRAFNPIVTDRYLVKSERKEANRFTLYYSYGDSILPQVRGLNFNADNAFVIESTLKKDTITYWLRDTALVNQDTLTVALTHHITDTLGVLRQQIDTLTLLSKQPYAKRLKDQTKKWEDWQKQQEKKKKRGEPYDSIMPQEPLKLTIKPSGEMDPDQNVTLTSPEPLNAVDTAHIHLYAHAPGDSLWYKEPFAIERKNEEEYTVKAEWKPGIEYSLEADTATFSTIYGVVSAPIKQGLKVRTNDSYATLMMTVNGMNGKAIIAQLLNAQDQVIKESETSTGRAEFFYLTAGKYYMRLIVDENGNGKWDTGDYDTGKQPEAVYYYPEVIECKANWDLNLSWMPDAKPLYQQKPSEIVKQKADKERKVQHRNLDRAKKLGIEYVKQNM
jgi:uncharacterized protein (DUF2141 family)